MEPVSYILKQVFVHAEQLVIVLADDLLLDVEGDLLELVGEDDVELVVAGVEVFEDVPEDLLCWHAVYEFVVVSIEQLSQLQDA